MHVNHMYTIRNIFLESNNTFEIRYFYTNFYRFDATRASQ